MDSRKKAMAAEIAGKLGGSKKPAGPSPDKAKDKDYAVDAETAAEEFLEAIASKDAKGIVEAFTALKAAC